MTNNSEILAVYPSSLFLFPGEDLPLCVFDDALKSIVNDSKKNGSRFGLEFIGNEDHNGWGTIVELKKVLDTNSIGEMVVLVTGVSFFRIQRIEPKCQYHQEAIVEEIELCDYSVNSDLIDMYFDYKSAQNKNENKAYAHINLLDVIKTFNLPSSEKFSYFITSGSEKEQIVLRHLKMLTEITRYETKYDQKFSMN